MPALVIEGEQRIASTVEGARVMAESLRNAALLLVPNAGHSPQVEQPQISFRAVGSFLNRR